MPEASRRMSRVDTAWLRMDNDVNLMMIVGVWLLQPGIGIEALRDRVVDKLLKYERFRQKVVPDAMGANWVPDTDFDLRHHVTPHRLAREAGQSERAALQALAGELANTPLDPSRPLWQFHLVENYEGGSAMLARVHHCIGDGIALISVMLSLTDGGADPPRRRRRDADDGEADWLAEAVVKPFTGLATKAIGVSGLGLTKSLDMLSHPQQGLWGSIDMARIGAKVVADLAALALMPDDSATRLKGKPIGHKIVAWSEPVPLDRVKVIGKALSCSINDVLLASVAGA
ncbi:MAG TPA: wax ester/triacylglycerol synthase domain-containing protein, partial [Burkholderiaceae bacterium]|nr:wax ester/triacylglycerol synthase domain-containing protein [Burkholderiaceae bacterium]